MTKKQLIKLLKDLPDNAIITTRDYTGCNHPVLTIEKVHYKKKGDKFSNSWEDPNYFPADTNTEYMDRKTRTFKKDIIYLETE